MSKTQMMPFVFMVVGVLGGCGSSDSGERIAKLQEQIGRVAQQLSDTKKQVDGLQEANQQSVKALEDLAATVERLQTGASIPTAGKAANRPQAALPAQGRERKVFAGHADTATASMVQEGGTVSPEDGELEGELLTERGTGAAMVAMSCSEVWKQLGQGKTPESAARVLGIPVAAVRACEQKVGRSSASR